MNQHTSEQYAAQRKWGDRLFCVFGNTLVMAPLIFLVAYIFGWVGKTLPMDVVLCFIIIPPPFGMLFRYCGGKHATPELLHFGRRA